MDVYDGHSNDDENTIDISLAIFRGHKGEVMMVKICLIHFKGYNFYF